MRVRRVTREDLDRVTAIESSAFRSAWSRSMLEAELDNELSRFLVAVEENPEAVDELIGYAVFWLVVDEVHLLKVATHPSHQRRGVASVLIREMLEEARDMGARFVTLEVRASNEAALALYERHAFRCVGIRSHYYTEGEDAVMMELEL